MKRLRTLLGIGLGLAVVAGAGWYISQTGTTSVAGRASGPLCGGCGDPRGYRRRRQGRDSGGRPRLGNGDAAQHRQRQDPDHRPAHQGRLQGRPDGQAGRPAGRGRSAALRRRPSAGHRHDAEGRGAAEERPDRPRALQEAGRPGLDRPPAVRHPDLPRSPVRGGAGGRPGPGRLGQAQRHLHQDPGAADRPHRLAFCRPGQLRDDGRRHQHLRHHPGAADLGDLHHSRRLAARRSASASRRAPSSKCGCSIGRRRPSSTSASSTATTTSSTRRPARSSCAPRSTTRTRPCFPTSS